MAHFTQEQKKAIAPAIKAICKKYGVKGSLSIQNNMIVVLNVKEGQFDVCEEMYKLVSSYKKQCENVKKREYHSFCLSHDVIENIRSSCVVNNVKDFDVKLLEFIKEVQNILMAGNYNNSDSNTDYYDVGWYAELNFGKFEAPYVFIQSN